VVAMTPQRADAAQDRIGHDAHAIELDEDRGVTQKLKAQRGFERGELPKSAGASSPPCKVERELATFLQPAEWHREYHQ
jgi:hypothetical protein